MRRITTSLGLAAVVSGLVTVAAGRARADIIFSDLGSPGDTYNQSALNTIAGASAIDFSGHPIQQQAVGMPFTPTSNATVSEIELAAGIVNGTNSINVQLRNDDGTDKPGNIIESFHFNNLPTAGSFSSDHLLTALSSHPLSQCRDPVLVDSLSRGC